MNVGSDDHDDENFTLEDFTKIAADVVATQIRSKDDIISEISNTHEDDLSDDVEEEAVLLIPTSAETTSVFDCYSMLLSVILTFHMITSSSYKK